MMYHSIARRLDADGIVKLDALLGDPDAEAEVQESRRNAAATAGFEVG
jgi:hypothetical protein